MSTPSNSAIGLSKPVKIALIALASVIVFLFVLVILLATSRGDAAPAPATVQPPTPIGTSTPANPDQPLILASPNYLVSGGAVEVFGVNWTPGDTVTVFLRDPAQPSEPIVSIGSGQVTEKGTVSVKVNYPTEPRWAKLSKADVIMQAASTGAYVSTTLDVAPAPMTPTHTATVISVPPTATPTTASTTVPPTATATRTPTRLPPTATATVPPITEWRGEYYANTTLTNAPIVVRNDSDVNFNWGRSAPASFVPVDNFSARWTRQFTFAAQTYRFSVRADDGVRVWLDNGLIIDEWHTFANTTYSRDVLMPAGLHSVRIEFYEAAGEAFIQFKIEQMPQTFNDWKGEYWTNPSALGLPAFTRNDVAINFDWATGAPINGLPVDNFSARWTRTLKFDNAVYRFALRADDGVRLYIDGLLIIDEWHDADGRTYTRDVQMSAGNHSLRIDYYEHTGGAAVAFSLQQAEDFTKWKGEYFANDKWSGWPALVRNDDRLDFDWGTGSPDSLIPPDRFSARWTRTIDLEAGVYRFDIVVDDGVRFYVDGVLVLDKIVEANNAAYTMQLNLAKGPHTFRLDYVEMTGQARLMWTRTLVSGGSPTPTATATPTATPTRTPTATAQPGLVIRGRVRLNGTGAGLGGVGIYRAFASYPAVLVATTDPNGNYVAAFQNIPGDEMVTVYAQLNGYTFDPLQYYWRHYYGYEDRTLDFVGSPVPTNTPTATPTATATATPTATPTATATSTVTPTVPSTAWRGEYFANTTLSGAPVLVRLDAAIQFDWGAAAPGTGLPNDHFSVRWTRAITAEQGVYRFKLQADDSVRVAVDGNWLFNQAESPQVEAREFEVNLAAGQHVLVVEYFENEGPSTIRVDYQVAVQ